MNAPREHSAILSTFIQIPFVFETIVLSVFEWPLKTGFTVEANSVDPEQAYRSSLVWLHTVCHRGFLNLSADKKSRRLLL